MNIKGERGSCDPSEAGINFINSGHSLPCRCTQRPSSEGERDMHQDDVGEDTATSAGAGGFQQLEGWRCHHPGGLAWGAGGVTEPGL